VKTFVPVYHVDTREEWLKGSEKLRKLKDELICPLLTIDQGLLISVQKLVTGKMTSWYLKLPRLVSKVRMNA